MIERVESRDTVAAVRIDARIARIGAAVAAVGLPLALYIRTMAPTVYNIDSAEFATAAKTAGIPHPPGYPLYIIIAHAFTWLPVGDVGFRVNLMSAVFGALALYSVYCIVQRLTHESIAALVATWTLGLSYPFWADAVVAEVYTLDAALVAGTFLFLLRWDDDRRIENLVAAAVLFGLSLTNRTTNLLALPAIALFVAPAWREDRRRITGAALAAIPPLALYAFLPLRSLTGAKYRWGSTYDLSAVRHPIDLTDPQMFWGYVTARVFQPLLHMYTWPDRIREAAIFGGNLWAAFLGGGVFVAGLGVVWLATRRGRAAALLLLGAAPSTLFFINYAAPDKDTMFLTTYVVAAVFVGCGVAWLLALIPEIQLPAPRPALAVGIAALWALLLVQTNFSLVDVSNDRRAPEESQALFHVADQNAVVIGRWTDIAPLEYLQIVQGERKDLALVHEWAMTDDAIIQIAQHNLREGRAVYVFRKESILEDDFGFSPVGDWYTLTDGGTKFVEVK